MAYSVINKSSDYQNTVLYTGDGSGATVSGVGFQPDLNWTKSRSNALNHAVTDAVRGVQKTLYTNLTAEQDDVTNGLTAFNSDGYVHGDHSLWATDTATYASWNWKANGAGSANTDGTINSTVSANSTSKFSIVSYTGTATAGTIGHGLGVAPKMIIVKILDEPYSWYTTTTDIGWVKTMYLEDTNGVSAGDTTIWNNTAPTSSVFSVGSNNDVNKSGSGLIAYCFADVVGYSKSGLFTGNGNANGTFVYTGFGISWLLIKKTNASGNY